MTTGVLGPGSARAGTACPRCAAPMQPGDIVEVVTEVGYMPFVTHAMCPRDPHKAREPRPEIKRPKPRKRRRPAGDLTPAEAEAYREGRW